MRSPADWFDQTFSPRVRSLGWLTLALLLAAIPAAHAQTATKIFVASNGSDTNVGSSVSPKRSFQAAHDSVAAGGEIVVLDTAGYGMLTITKSLSLVVPPGVNGFITSPADTSNITINAGADDVVSLRGLILEGGGKTNSGNPDTCISVASVGTLRVEDCEMRSFFAGVFIFSNTPVHLLMSGCAIRDMAEGLGVFVNTSPVDAILTDCTFSDTDTGILASGNRSQPAVVTAARCIFTNDLNPLNANPLGTIYADACTFSNSSTALFTAGSGQILSRGNNTLTGNADNGAFTATFAAQ